MYIVCLHSVHCCWRNHAYVTCVLGFCCLIHLLLLSDAFSMMTARMGNLVGACPVWRLLFCATIVGVSSASCGNHCRALPQNILITTADRPQLELPVLEWGKDCWCLFEEACQDLILHILWACTSAAIDITSSSLLQTNLPFA